MGGGKVMMRIAVLQCLLLSNCLCALGKDRPTTPWYEYNVVRSHEIKPPRRSIPLEGVEPGFHQLRLKLTVSASGDVITAEANGDREALKLWPQIEAEVGHWKFVPFEIDAVAVTAEVEEYIDVFPAERFPTNHRIAPTIQPNSKVEITLDRSGCFGRCPSYTITVSTDEIVFVGRRYVAAPGVYKDRIDANEVRKFAARFVDADFYSMDDRYVARVTDCPTYRLSISIDGHAKEVVDYMGPWLGMPAVITELEGAVDSLAQTERWIKGSNVPRQLN